MIRLGMLTVLASWVVLAPQAGAQGPARFRWQTGQVLHYKFEQTTTVVDTVENTTAETSTKVANTKRWQILAVDPAGVATLQLSLTALRLETSTPSGEKLTFDSANLDKSSPQLKEQLTKFVNQPLATLRVDAKGKVVEVKESKHGPASRYESETPFVVVLPDELKPGAAWERSYHITVEPPQGTGEKYATVQKYACKSVDSTGAALTVATSVVNVPPAAADRLPLLPSLIQGEVVFDVQGGFLKSAKLQIDREVTGHQGDGSSYRFKSVSTEEIVPNR